MHKITKGKQHKQLCCRHPRKQSIKQENVIQELVVTYCIIHYVIIAQKKLMSLFSISLADNWKDL